MLFYTGKFFKNFIAKTYSEAELILHNELGINSIAVTDVNVSQKRFSDFINSGRLDAEYYQPKYDDLFLD